MDKYRVTVWDKKANDPYYILEYNNEDDAKHVARSMQRHYIDDWGDHGREHYEVRLHRIQEANA